MNTNHVYVIGPVEGWPVKIGVAINVLSRLSELQCAHWDRLFIHAFYAATNKGSAYKIEKLVHYRLKANLMRGEWFNVMAVDAIKELDEVCDETKQARRIKNIEAHFENIEFIGKLDSMGFA